MNWTKPVFELKPNTMDYKYFGQTRKVINRKEILTKYKHRCCYCGGKYEKFVNCIHIDNKPVIICRFCMIISQLNDSTFDKYDIYYSTLSQLDIVRSTVNFILKNSRLPTPHEIDPNIKNSPFSPIEYINLLNNQEFKITFDTYKVFFIDVDLNFILSNYDINMFTSENDSEESLIEYPNHILSKKEETILKNLTSIIKE